MKTLKLIGPAAALLLLGAQAASAASLGTIEYDAFINGNNNFIADLGGVSPGIGDADVQYNEFNGATSLPGGLPVGYDVHIPRTFIGDRDESTADPIHDRFLFKLDESTLGGQPAARVRSTLNLAFGFNTGMENVTFEMFETNDSGDLVGGPLDSASGEGTIRAVLDPDTDYLLRVAGNLLSGADNTNVGQYKIVYGSTVVPLPAALPLLLTGIGALFGIRRMRKQQAEAA